MILLVSSDGSRWYRIVTVAAEGMASCESARRQRGAADHAKLGDRAMGILGAARFESTRRAEQADDHRRDDGAINT